MTNVPVGTTVVFTGFKPHMKLLWEDVTLGKEYVIAGSESDGDTYFRDDVGARNYSACFDGCGIFDIVN